MKTCRSEGSSTSRSKTRVGATECRGTRAPRTAKLGAGCSGAGGAAAMSPGARRAGCPAVPLRRGHATAARCRSSSKKAGHDALDHVAAGDPLPARLDRTDQAVALVDRGDRELVRLADPIDDQTLDVLVERLESRVVGAEVLPGRELELAFGGARRARVEADDPLRRARAHEEGEPDRDPQARPQLLGELEALEPEEPAAGRPVGTVPRAHRDAGLAGAENPPLLEVEQVAVILREIGAAEVAALLGGLRPTAVAGEAHGAG